MTKITMGDEIIYAHTHNHPDAADYRTLADIRRDLHNGILAISYIYLRAHCINPDDYQTLGDCIDDYLVRVHGWDGDIASLRTIRLVKQK